MADDADTDVSQLGSVQVYSEVAPSAFDLVGKGGVVYRYKAAGTVDGTWEMSDRATVTPTTEGRDRKLGKGVAHGKMGVRIINHGSSECLVDIAGLPKLLPGSQPWYLVQAGEDQRHTMAVEAASPDFSDPNLEWTANNQMEVTYTCFPTFPTRPFTGDKTTVDLIVIVDTK
jgi:hypothetical protein